jgi:hypothetical protein
MGIGQSMLIKAAVVDTIAGRSGMLERWCFSTCASTAPAVVKFSFRRKWSERQHPAITFKKVQRQDVKST